MGVMVGEGLGVFVGVDFSLVEVFGNGDIFSVVIFEGVGD